MATDDHEGDRLPRILSETVLIALAPALAYVVAFAYESGYALHFRIPFSLINIRLETIFVSGGALLLLFVGIFVILNAVFMFVRDLNKDKAKLFQPLLFDIIVLMLILILFRHKLLNILIWVGVICLVIIIQYVVPIFEHRKAKGYIKKLEMSAKAEAPVALRSLVGRLATKYGIENIKLIFYSAFFVPWVAFSLGVSTAQREEYFLVIQNIPELVILRIYGDNVVSAPLIRNENKIEPTIIIQKIGNGPPLEAKRQKVGPLEILSNPDLRNVGT